MLPARRSGSPALSKPSPELIEHCPQINSTRDSKSNILAFVSSGIAPDFRGKISVNSALIPVSRALI